MLPEFLKPKWTRVVGGLTALALAAYLFLFGIADAGDGYIIVPMGWVFALSAIGIVLLLSLLVDLIGTDPEDVDDSPEAVTARMEKRKRKRGS